MQENGTWKKCTRKKQYQEHTYGDLVLEKLKKFYQEKSYWEELYRKAVWDKQYWDVLGKPLIGKSAPEKIVRKKKKSRYKREQLINAGTTITDMFGICHLSLNFFFALHKCMFLSHSFLECVPTNIGWLREGGRSNWFAFNSATPAYIHTSSGSPLKVTKRHKLFEVPPTKGEGNSKEGF